jgi:long-subunit fatty acid transport protein
MKLALLTALPFALFANGALAQDYQAKLTAFYESTVRALSTAPELVAAVAAANAARAGLDQAAIDGMDAAWKAEVGTADTPTLTPVLNNPAADFLRSTVDTSGGAILEAFATDALGLNVAASAPTSDMWQGDEDKFTAVFPNGPDAVLYGEVELDESTQTYQAQISIPVVDPATSTVIGTLTVGVNADSLQ